MLNMMKKTIALLLTMAVLPLFASNAKPNIFNPRDFGAKADGKTMDTKAIQSAIDAAAAVGGGTVLLDSGTFLSGSIFLKDNIRLEIKPTATLLGSPNKEDYNPDDFCVQNVILKDEDVSNAHLIIALNVKNVELCGGGTIDGNGMSYWMSVPGNENVKLGGKFKFPKWRPSQMLFFCETQNIRLHNLSLVNPPYWSTNFLGCSDIIITNLFIQNDHRGHNQDGLDIDACSNVVISDCIIDSEDDCIAIRCQGERLLKKESICENITVSNCVLKTRRCNAFRIGVGKGIIRNMVVSNVVVRETRTGICFLNTYKRRDGVALENIKFSNCIFNCQNPIAMYTDNIKWGRMEGRAHTRNVTFANCSFRGTRTNLIGGDTNINISDILFFGCDFTTDGGDLITDTEDYHMLTEWGEPNWAKAVPHAFVVKNARDVRFINCKMRWGNITHQWKKAIVFDNCFDCVPPDAKDAPDCPPVKK